MHPRFSDDELRVHSVLIRAVYARVAARCYQHILQVFDELRVFLVKVGSAQGSLAAAGFLLTDDAWRKIIN